jgi:hypothetical protein
MREQEETEKNVGRVRKQEKKEKDSGKYLFIVSTPICNT